MYCFAVLLHPLSLRNVAAPFRALVACLYGITMDFGDDAQNSHELLRLLDMILAS
jgi:hypothetical protein